jgi:membrane fusion protein, multidrug efflux system
VVMPVLRIPRRERARAWAGAGILALAGSIGGYAIHSQRAAAELTQRSEPVAAPVVVTTVERRDLPIELKGIGTVQAYNTVTVKPLVGGQITQIAFTEGQTVHRGEILARIDSRSLTAQLRQAQANRQKDQAQLDNARKDLVRFISMPADAIPRQQVDAQQALVEVLEAAVVADQAAIENAKVQLDYTTVASPIDGVTGIRIVDAGNVISPSDAGIVVITQLRPIAVIFTLPADIVASLPAGWDRPQQPTPVEVFDRSDSVRLATGSLALIDNQIDRSTNTIRLKAIFGNSDGALRPGEFVNTHLLKTVLHGAVVVPRGAIQYDESGAFSWLVRADSTVEPKRIILGPTSANLAAIERGLTPGDRVVLDGHYNLRRGAAVLVQTNEHAASRMDRNALDIP